MAHDLVKNMLTVLKRTGDISHAERIIYAIERELTRKNGGHVITVQTARTVSDILQKKITESFTKEDIIKEQIRPELGAGIRVVVDDEREYNASLQYKLKRLLGV